MNPLRRVPSAALMIALVSTVLAVSVGGCSGAESAKASRPRVGDASRFPGVSGMLARKSFVSETSVPASVSATDAVEQMIRRVPSGHGAVSAPGAIRSVAALVPLLGADSASGSGTGGRVALRKTGGHLVIVRQEDGLFDMFVVARAPGSAFWSLVTVPGQQSLVARAVMSSKVSGAAFVPVVCDDGRDTFWVLTGSGPEARAVPVEFPPEERCWAGSLALELGQSYPQEVMFEKINCVGPPVR